MISELVAVWALIYGAVRLIVCLNRYNLGPKTGGDKSCEFYPLWVHFVGLCSSLFVLSCFHFYWICPSSHYDLLLDGLKIYNLISAPWWGRGERGRGEGLGERCEGKVTIFDLFVIRHRRIKVLRPIRLQHVFSTIFDFFVIRHRRIKVLRLEDKSVEAPEDKSFFPAPSLQGR